MIPVEGAQEKDAPIGLDSPLNRGAERQVGQIFHRRRRRRSRTLKWRKPLLPRSPTGNDYDERGVKNRQRTTNTRCFMVMVPPFGNATTLPLPHQERDEGAERRGEEQPRRNPAMEVTLVTFPSYCQAFLHAIYRTTLL